MDLVAGKTYGISIQAIGSTWGNFSAPFVSSVEDVDASTVTSFSFAHINHAQNLTFTAATTGNHRFTVEGYIIDDIHFAYGNYGLTVTETVTENVSPPSAPRNLAVSSQTHDSVTLTWEAPENGVVESYQILRRSRDGAKYEDNLGDAEFAVIEDNTGSSATTYTDTSVDSRTRYVYRVKARNAGGLGKRSSYANAETLSDNRAATGVPVITGSPTVGQTLMVDTTGIDDPNGLEDVTFSYQWLADDASISGATRSRYTLTDSEEGKAIKVRVSFTDDEENQESLTSVATAAVEAAPVADTLVSFILVDTSNQSQVATLTNGMTVTLDQPASGSYGIRVELATNAGVGSVHFELTGPKTVSQTENIAPYSLYGDNGTDLNGEGLPTGMYTLRATAYSESGRGGDELQVLEVSFTVSDS